MSGDACDYTHMQKNGSACTEREQIINSRLLSSQTTLRRDTHSYALLVCVISRYNTRQRALQPIFSPCPPSPPPQSKRRTTPVDPTRTYTCCCRTDRCVAGKCLGNHLGSRYVILYCYYHYYCIRFDAAELFRDRFPVGTHRAYDISKSYYHERCPKNHAVITNEYDFIINVIQKKNNCQKLYAETVKTIIVHWMYKV